MTCVYECYFSARRKTLIVNAKQVVAVTKRKWAINNANKEECLSGGEAGYVQLLSLKFRFEF